MAGKHTSFPVIAGAQVVSGGDTDAKAEPGCIQMYRYSDGQFCMAQYVQNGNRVAIDAGNVTVPNDATLKAWSVQKASIKHGGRPMAGIALATIASQKWGWIAIRGYVGSALTENVGTAMVPLYISTTTEGYMTDLPSLWLTATGYASAANSGAMAVAIARDTTAGLASVTIRGCWGV
jgi:hypothetical protein